MMTNTVAKAKTTTEELFSHIDLNRSCGTVEVKEKTGRLYALIGRRWCRVARVEGKLIEIGF